MRLFNLVVAHEPGRWGFREALRLVKSLLPGVVVFDTPRNLLLLKTGDPFEAVERLRGGLGEDSPVLRAVPLQGETLPYVEDVAAAVRELVAETVAGGRPSFAVRLEGRLVSRKGGRVGSREAVEKIAEGIDLPVRLDDPDILVLVKVVRLSRELRYAGIMVAPPAAVYSRDAVKRRSR